MKKKTQVFAMVLLCAFVLTSCEKSSDPEEEERMETIDPCETTVSFSATILPLIEAKCAPCHIGEEAERGQLDSFAAASSRAAGMRTRTTSKDMPRTGSLTDQQIQDIACWVQQGALDN